MNHEPALTQRLRRHVEVLAGTIGERHVWRPAALQAAAAYIREGFDAAGCAVVAQAYDVAELRCENLEVILPGDSRPDEIILVGAHYDTVRGSPGADDNASGVAALLEITRALQTQARRRTVRLVAFVNEESPFFFTRQMGSLVYARAARQRRDDIRLMLSLEMLGCYSDRPGTQDYPPMLRWFYPDRGNFIAFVSNLRSRRALATLVRTFRSVCDFPVESLASPPFVPGVALSDQLSFWRTGFRAVMVTDTAFYRNVHYHAATDTPEKIDYERLARLTTGLAEALGALADGPQGP